MRLISSATIVLDMRVATEINVSQITVQSNPDTLCLWKPSLQLGQLLFSEADVASRALSSD